MADALRHVKFVGRPKAPAPRSSQRGVAPSSSSPPSSLSPSHSTLAARHRAARSTEGPDPFLSWVLERAGLEAGAYRGEPLRRRLSACLRALHAETEAQAREILEAHPDRLAVAINTLLIGVTEFFRDALVFDTLRFEVLPHLSPPHGRPLRVWSAACSTGAELYSMAMLLEQAGLLKDCFLLGTDFRSDAIDRARAALYNHEDLWRVAPADRRRYLEASGKQWRPLEPLRRHTHWRVADLGRHMEAGPWDMILWRNMAIYLQPEAAAALWQGLVSVLAPGGILVVGRAERPPETLPLLHVKRCIYQAFPSGAGHASGLRPKLANHNHPKTAERFR